MIKPQKNASVNSNEWTTWQTHPWPWCQMLKSPTPSQMHKQKTSNKRFTRSYQIEQARITRKSKWHLTKSRRTKLSLQQSLTPSKYLNMYNWPPNLSLNKLLDHQRICQEITWGVEQIVKNAKPCSPSVLRLKHITQQPTLTEWATCTCEHHYVHQTPD